MEPEKYIQPEVVLNPKPEINYTPVILIVILLLAAIFVGYMWYASKSTANPSPVDTTVPTERPAFIPESIPDSVPIPDDAFPASIQEDFGDGTGEFTFMTSIPLEEVVVYYENEIKSKGGTLEVSFELEGLEILSGRLPDGRLVNVYIKPEGDQSSVSLLIEPK